mmetsp:Transcript_12315/g.51823  ORF Transcript_12315/g.51823 Transcript_12315/m.51823 type:complete len:255 (-) Transcript_12315:1742-2506(-)
MTTSRRAVCGTHRPPRAGVTRGTSVGGGGPRRAGGSAGWPLPRRRLRMDFSGSPDFSPRRSPRSARSRPRFDARTRRRSRSSSAPPRSAAPRPSPRRSRLPDPATAATASSRGSASFAISTRSTSRWRGASRRRGARTRRSRAAPRRNSSRSCTSSSPTPTCGSVWAANPWRRRRCARSRRRLARRVDTTRAWRGAPCRSSPGRFGRPAPSFAAARPRRCATIRSRPRRRRCSSTVTTSVCESRELGSSGGSST